MKQKRKLLRSFLAFLSRLSNRQDLPLPPGAPSRAQLNDVHRRATKIYRRQHDIESMVGKPRGQCKTDVIKSIVSAIYLDQMKKQKLANKLDAELTNKLPTKKVKL